MQSRKSKDNLTSNVKSNPKVEQALIEAAKAGRFTEVKTILSNNPVTSFNINARSTDPKDEGRTALIWACIKGTYKDVEMLLNAGADINATDNKKYTPLIYAAALDKINVVTLLVSYIQLLINFRNNDGNTALNITIAQKFTICALAILNNDEVNPFIASNEGYNALHFAALNGDTTILRSIINNINCSNENLAKLTNSGDTALTLAIKGGHVEFAKTLAKLATEKGFDIVNIADSNGKTPAQLADEKGYDDLVLELTQHISTLEKFDYKKLIVDSSNNALINKILSMNLGETLFLKENEDNLVNVTNKSGLTALSATIIRGMLGNAMLLMGDGANPYIKDTNGKDAIDLARYFGYESLATTMILTPTNKESTKQI